MSRFRAQLAAEIDLPGKQTFVYSGGPQRSAPVQLYGMFRGCVSVDNVCTQFARQLLASVPGANLHGYTGRPFFEPDLEAHAFLDPAAAIAVFYGTPETVPERLFAHETSVGGFVCETDAIPPAWVRTCNRLDLVLVPSRFCRAAFQSSGVTKPVLVVPHGLEPDYRPYDAKRRDRPFVFYATANTNTIVRKGMTELVRCFRRAFAERSDVLLWLRVGRSGALLETLAESDVRPDDPSIRVEPPAPLSTAEFARLYSRAHCTVHPSKGEGFGLIPLQSIACETPVIAPNATGMADYVSADNAMVLRTKGWTDNAQVYYGTGGYAEIDEDHLVELLLHAEANWEAEYEKVRAGARAIRERYTWERALSEIVTLLLELTELSGPEARADAIRAHDEGAIERRRQSPEPLPGATSPFSLESHPNDRWTEARDRLEPEVWPVCHPSFSLTPGEKIFTIGSCFARNMEHYLDLVGFDVPALTFDARSGEATGRPISILNKYTPPTIFQELSWAAGVSARGGGVAAEDVESLRLDLSDGSVADLQLASRPVNERRFLERRQGLCDLFAQAFRSDSIFITLGHIEAWLDKETGLFTASPPLYPGQEPGRFVFAELTFDQCLDYLRRTVDLLRKRNPSCKIVVTTSPVPLGRTFSGRDVILANEYSKCMLRVVSEMVARATPKMDYFPSFEAVRMTSGPHVWREDRRHVRSAFVGRIAQHFVASYVPGLDVEDAELLAAAAALESDPEPRKTLLAPLLRLRDPSSYRTSRLVALAELCAALEETEAGRRIVAELVRRPETETRYGTSMVPTLRSLGCFEDARQLAGEAESS